MTAGEQGAAIELAGIDKSFGNVRAVRGVSLTIDKGWQDAEGRPLTASYRKTIVAGPPDDQPVEPESWALVPPRTVGDAPLIVRLAKPLDHALLQGAADEEAGPVLEGVVRAVGLEGDGDCVQVSAAAFRERAELLRELEAAEGGATVGG